jgi:hypothetical protein
MTYLQTVNEIRAAAYAANPNGRFHHGRRVDTSQKFDGAYPLIWLYPFQITDAVEVLDTSDLLIGFWMQDAPDSSVEEREAIIGQMDTLVDLFLEKIRLNKQVSLTNVIREPQYLGHSGTLSGFGLRFNYQNFAPCP